MPRKSTILPNKLFHKLWDEAKNTDINVYTDNYLKRESDEYIDFDRKYNIDNYLALKMLRRIHEYSNMDFSELLAKTGLKNSDIADRYCIAIRNIQQWANKKAKCPSYVVLMILRDEHMLNFDGMITTEWEVRFKKTYPAVYEKKSSNDTMVHSTKLHRLNRNINKYEEYKKEINVKTDIDKILKKTDYLSNIIRK